MIELAFHVDKKYLFYIAIVNSIMCFNNTRWMKFYFIISEC